jgi:NDP-sugar pyrophosphorylase family protein
VGPDAVLVADVEVEAGARVSDSVLWQGCRMGPGSEARGALLGPGVVVGCHARALPGAVLGQGTRLSDHSRSA